MGWVEEYAKVYKTNQIMWLFGTGMFQPVGLVTNQLIQ